MDKRLAGLISRRSAMTALAGAACSGLMVSQAKAAAPSASAWSESTHSRFRLIRGTDRKPGEHRAGIQLDLKPGYKTYWRHPGDSGVPPVFRFDGSQNLKQATVHFPAPVRFDDGAGGFSIGYRGTEVILPITIEALNPREPVQLNMEVDYAVCEKLCVPAHGKASLMFAGNGAGSPHEATLASAMRRVPVVLALGGSAPFSVKALHRGKQPEHFLVETTAPPGSKTDLFIEAASPWFFDVKPATNGIFPVLVVEKDKAPDCTGADITMTLVSEGGGIEVRTTLDMAMIAS